jgi:hypothetical protein
MTVVLVEAMKEQDNLINDLKTQNSELILRLQKLESIVNSLTTGNN